MAEERLQKILAQAGLASRRKAEELIAEGRVAVNGQIVTEMGTKADAERDHIKVDGKLIKLPKGHVYIALNKPRDVVTTLSDPEGRQTVLHLLKGVKDRVFPVGRLDYLSEGLLLLTTDGEFSNRLTSPSGHVEKVYVVKANGHLSEAQLEDFRNGVPLDGRRTAPAGIKLIREGENPWYEVRLTEGRQNQIRIMFKHFHHLVEKLRRVRIGFLTLGALRTGEWRYLEAEEVERFRKLLKQRELKTFDSRGVEENSGEKRLTFEKRRLAKKIPASKLAAAKKAVAPVGEAKPAGAATHLPKKAPARKA
jgi:23S rRNA pseudouridine2605 synthase